MLDTVAMPAVTRRRARRRRPSFLVAASVGFLILMVIIAILAPVIAPYPPDATEILAANEPPSPAHWFGTDSTGRDILSRVIYGARLSLLAPLLVVIFTTLCGALAGLTAARAGGATDLVITRAMDIVFAFPSLLLALLAVAIVGPGLTAPIVALAIAYIPFIGRIVRTAAVEEQARPYVGAHTVMGFSSMWITMRHILPNITPLLLAQASLAFGYAMIDIAALSYLGLGVQPPAADWGSMIAQSQSAVLQGNLWGVIFPGLAVMLTVLSVNVLGETLSDRVTVGGGR